jgi:hypothetical protein
MISPSSRFESLSSRRTKTLLPNSKKIPLSKLDSKKKLPQNFSKVGMTARERKKTFSQIIRVILRKEGHGTRLRIPGVPRPSFGRATETIIGNQTWKLRGLRHANGESQLHIRDLTMVLMKNWLSDSVLGLGYHSGDYLLPTQCDLAWQQFHNRFGSHFHRQAGRSTHGALGLNTRLLRRTHVSGVVVLVTFKV